MSDTNGHMPDEWLSVSACAKRLALHERQVRRYADRLPDTDRTPAGQTPLLVRVSSVQALRDRTVSVTAQVISDGEEADTGQDRQDSVPSSGLFSAQQIAVIYEAQLQAKDAVIQAKDALIAEKDTRLAVLSEVSEERRQEIARLRKQLVIAAAPIVPPVVEIPPEPTPEPVPQDAPPAAQVTRTTQAQDGRDNQMSPPTEPRRRAWWPFGKR